MVEELNIETNLQGSASMATETPHSTMSRASRKSITSSQNTNKLEVQLLLQLRVVHVAVTDDTPVMIIWSRG